MKISKSKIVLIVAGVLLIGAVASEPTNEPEVVQTVEATPEITPFVNNIKEPKLEKVERTESPTEDQQSKSYPTQTPEPTHIKTEEPLGNDGVIIDTDEMIKIYNKLATKGTKYKTISEKTINLCKNSLDDSDNIKFTYAYSHDTIFFYVNQIGVNKENVNKTIEKDEVLSYMYKCYMFIKQNLISCGDIEGNVSIAIVILDNANPDNMLYMTIDNVLMCDGTTESLPIYETEESKEIVKPTEKPKATEIPSVSDKEAGEEAETLFYDYCPNKNGAVFEWYFRDYTNPNEFIIYVKIPGAGDKCFGSGKIVSSVRKHLTEIYNAARKTLRKCGDTNDSINIEIILENDQEDGEWDYICEYVNDILDYSFVD